MTLNDQLRGETFPLVELSAVGPRVFHLLVFQSSDHRQSEWQDVEIIGFTARYPVVLALTANPRTGGLGIGRMGEVAHEQLHSDESELWQAHLHE
jgi:hypothetical protein